MTTAITQPNQAILNASFKVLVSTNRRRDGDDGGKGMSVLLELMCPLLVLDRLNILECDLNS